MDAKQSNWMNTVQTLLSSHLELYNCQDFSSQLFLNPYALHVQLLPYVHNDQLILLQGGPAL